MGFYAPDPPICTQPSAAHVAPPDSTTTSPEKNCCSAGPASLTDGELLRILIGSGSAQASGADLADHLLDHLLVAGPQVVSISG
ncbi:MAG: UPF0758 domain-containing protein [Burkholderiaceae bacterium]